MERKRWDQGWDYVTVSFAPGVKDALREEAFKRNMSLSAALREGAQRFLGRGGAEHPSVGHPNPAPPTVPDTDDAFGNWLAGFIDGEGCFGINPVRGGKFYTVGFGLTCRDDDGPILETIQRRVGFGVVYRLRNQRASQPNAKPVASWQVHNKAAVAALVAFLDRYPLRAKKARDYVIWREAALLWIAYKGNRWTPDSPRDELARLKLQLQAGRVYA